MGIGKKTGNILDDCGLKGNSSWRDKSVCHDVLVKEIKWNIDFGDHDHAF